MDTLRIGIDLMGAETPPSLILEAVASLSNDFYINTDIHLFGTAEVEPLQYTLHLATETISMQDLPVRAIKKKTHSSLVMGLEALKKKKIDAFISLANTGALIAGARLIVGTMEGILRPALLTECPTSQGRVCLLDVGGSVKTTSAELLQHAYLGAAYAEIVLGKRRPKLALFNIGEEAYKGTKELKEVYERLSTGEGPFEFVGNKEPADLFSHQADVFVTGGFAGNIFIKTAEATARFLKAPHAQANRAAVVAGARGLILKCHGQSTKEMLQNALLQTKELLVHDYLLKLKIYLEERVA